MSETAATRRRSRRTLLPGILVRALVGLVGAVLISIHGNQQAARGVLYAVLVITATSIASPKAAMLFQRATVGLGRAVGAVFAYTAIALIDVVVGFPGHLFAIVRRRSPLTDMGSTSPTAWRATPQSDTTTDAPRAFGGDLPRRRRAPSEGRLPMAGLLRCLGVAALLLLLNSVLGYGVQLVAPPPADERLFSEHTRLSGLAEIAPVAGRMTLVEPASPSDAPAAAAEPWHRQLARDERATLYHWEPYITFEAVDTKTALVHITDGVRSSWRAPGPTAHRPVVWFFGGSTMQGIGQRDDHTIPSQVARLAAAAGEPITVVNYGNAGATNFSEVLELEQHIAVQPRPDLVVFYDGATDLGIQSFYPSTQPTEPPATIHYRTGDPSVYDRWRRSSLVNRSASYLDHKLFPAAGAAPHDEPTPPVPRLADPAVVARDTLGVYERGLSLARGILPAGVRAAYFWQPTRWSASSAASALVRRELPAGVVDLTDVFDHVGSPVYLDAIHTNERGAELVAQRMWPTIRRELG